MNQVQELKNEILSRREARLKRDCSPYPRNNPTASGLSECARDMVLSILFWQQVPAFEPYVKARLEEGSRQENYVLQELIGLGFVITENNPPPFELFGKNKQLIMRGRIDGKIEWKGKKLPFEIKSLDPNVFEGINTIEDFYSKFWMKRYVLQMMSYLFANNEQDGLFIIVDMKGHWKVIEITLDMGIMEGILQLCERVVDSVAKCRDIANANVGRELQAIEKALPPFHNDLSVCRRCKINKILCFPPMDFGPGAQIVDDIELEGNLARRTELADLVKEFDIIDKQIKERFKNIPLAVCGNYQITGEAKTRQMKAQPAKEAYMTTYWQTRVDKIA